MCIRDRHEKRLFLDEHGERHGLEPPIAFEGLLLVELEGAVDDLAQSGALEDGRLEFARVPGEQEQAPSHRLARGRENACGLALRDLGHERVEDRAGQLWALEAIVDAKGLDGEGALADAAIEAMDRAPVTCAMEASARPEAKGRPVRGARRTGGTRAMRRSEVLD